MFPTVTVKLFGIANGAQIYTIMFFAIPLSSNFGLVVVHYIQDLIGIVNIFRIAGLMTFINLILLYNFDEKEVEGQKKDSIELDDKQELEMKQTN